MLGELLLDFQDSRQKTIFFLLRLQTAEAHRGICALMSQRDNETRCGIPAFHKRCYSDPLHRIERAL